jgi:hypothetical protein
MYLLVSSDILSGQKITNELSAQLTGSTFVGSLDDNEYIQSIEQMATLPAYDNYVIHINAFIEDFDEIVKYAKRDHEVTIIIIERATSDILKFVDKDNVIIEELLDIMDKFYNALLIKTKYGADDNTYVYDLNTICAANGFEMDGKSYTLSSDFDISDNVIAYESERNVFDNFTENEINDIVNVNFIPQEIDNDNVVIWYINSIINPSNNVENYAISIDGVEQSIDDLIEIYKTDDSFTPTELEILKSK